MHISCIPVESTARTFVLLVMRKQRHLTHISETAVTLMRAVFLYISILFRHFWLDQLCFSSCSRNIFYPVGLQSRKQTNQSVKLILSIYQMSLKWVFNGLEKIRCHIPENALFSSRFSWFVGSCFDILLSIYHPIYYLYYIYRILRTEEGVMGANILQINHKLYCIEWHQCTETIN